VKQGRPYDHRGRFVSRRCPDPNCDCGTLQPEGDGFWRCDGLVDPGHPDMELQACAFSHMDGRELSKENQ
jgi:hypothetical protein